MRHRCELNGGALAWRARQACGDPGSLRISNTGTLRGRLSLTAQTEGDGLLAERLQLVVKSAVGGKDRVLYSGSLAGLRDLTVSLVAAGNGRTFRLRVTLPLAEGNETQGLTATTTFSWRAVAAT